MKTQLIDFGGRSPERAHANDAGADVFSPKDAVIRREISVSCLWDLDASPETKSQGLFHQIQKEVTFCGLLHGAYA